MNLFSEEISIPDTIIKEDGKVIYYGKIISHQEANFYYQNLLNDIAWMNDKAIIFGKERITKRKVAWYGDTNYEYTYSNATKLALPWTSTLLKLKAIAEKITQESYNSCLLNLYHDGSEGMAWHSDGEKDLKRNGAIASLSFGAERKFSFKHKVSKERISILLEHGSLLLMTDTTQTNWLHRLPPTKLISKPRINLTFRTIEN